MKLTFLLLPLKLHQIVPSLQVEHFHVLGFDDAEDVLAMAIFERVLFFPALEGVDDDRFGGFVHTWLSFPFFLFRVGDNVFELVELYFVSN